jgi:hypothetical protein
MIRPRCELSLETRGPTRAVGAAALALALLAACKKDEPSPSVSVRAGR